MGVKMIGRGLQRGFTIVELLIVIVVIGILAAITIVGYNGVTSRARQVVLQNDLSQAAGSLEMTRLDAGAYPVSLGAAGLKASAGTTFAYTLTGGDYCLSATNGSLVYYINNTTRTTPTEGPCTGPGCNDSGQLGSYPNCVAMNSCGIDNPSSIPSGTVIAPEIGTINLADVYGYTCLQPASCPSGFIAVPGSTMFNKPNGFCIMKYEAKQASATVPVSQAAGNPWVSISRNDSLTYSQNVVGCSGCHLLSGNEAMVVSHNLLSVESNWSGGHMGAGNIYRGHSDSSPANSLVASSDDSDGYYGTGDVAPSVQRRTLTLTNGQIIWDYAGDVAEATSANIAGNLQPGIVGEVSYVNHDWSDPSLAIRSSSPLTPAYGTPAAAGWNSVQGIGKLRSNYGEALGHVWYRGGTWTNGGIAGVFSLDLGLDATNTASTAGFRVAR